jgi:hypothetical protein
MNPGDAVYMCFDCRQLLRPDDVVVQTVRIEMVSTLGGQVEQPRKGEWFHARHFFGMPYKEIDRGTLEEVLARS